MKETKRASIKRCLPERYKTAIWRNTTPVDPVYREIGIGFCVAGGSDVFFALDMQQAHHVIETLSDYIKDHQVHITQ